MGTSSSGDALRLFSIAQVGEAEQVALEERAGDLFDAAWELLRKRIGVSDEAFPAHVYCTPKRISVEPLTIDFDLRGDYVSPTAGQVRFKPTRFRLRLAPRKIEIL